MNEKIVEIGDDFILSGIVSLPEKIDIAKPAVVILNSGLMHRVGASRTSVQLARTLATEGYLVLRFDFSGIGDSEVQTDSLDPVDRIIQEVSASLDYMQNQYGTNRFVLYGLCSGAQNSFKSALKDTRIVGLAGVDNFGFPTKWFYVAHYAPRLLQPGHWKSFIVRNIKHLFSVFKRLANKSGHAVEEDLWPYPPKEFVERGYSQLVKRGLKFLYIYTGSWAKQYNYLNQFYDMYPSVNFGRSVELKFKPQMTHTMLEPESQQFVIANIVSWLKSSDWGK